MNVYSRNLSFLTYISLKTKGNYYRCRTSGAENGHLQAECRALEDILANSPDCLSAVSFGETFHTLQQWVDRVMFSLGNLILHSRPKIEVEEVQVGFAFGFKSVGFEPRVRCSSAEHSASKLLIEKCENCTCTLYNGLERHLASTTKKNVSQCTIASAKQCFNIF